MCDTKYCRGKLSGGNRYCGKCKKRKFKEKHPIKYFFNLLKQNAKRRGKSFSLTIDQFSEFCIKTGYLDKKGRYADSFTIDRIDHFKGYDIDNIAAITNRENAIKGNNEKKLKNTIEDCPF